jgi:tetratricopeptide (TPR) repeat protein
MKNRRKSKLAPVGQAGSQAKPPPAKSSSIIGWKLWLFRLMTVVVVPIVFLALVELTLRLAGIGYPTTFLLRFSDAGRKSFVQNSRFGWRFFGAQMGRTPFPICIPQSKTPNTVRIFVFGESAAYGDPEPRFGLPHMLQSLLELRYPGTRFEVVNAAMTAINSNVILPIARDCAGAGGDIWVIYMGNNEVIGPFGAGTVFGQQAPPLLLIRARLALAATRVGQLFDALRRKLQKPPPDKGEWGGMAMFLDQQVRRDDPRMSVVYDHFARNLEDIIRVGRHSGAGIVVSTVAVNLKDSAPFASAHRPGLSEADKTRWNQLYQDGIEAQTAGRYAEAAERFREAAQIDDDMAELRFREGWCALALGEIAAAQTNLVAARDLDTLRFRCDSQLNDLTKQAVSLHEGERVLLADAERAFAAQSPEGLPGDVLFYEHVHLTFAGNYLLARTLAAQIEKLLPERIGSRVAANQPWPSEADCARRLAWSDWSKQAALSDIFVRLGDPPFTRQPDHSARMQSLKAALGSLASATQPEGIKAARKICEAAVAAAPDDPLVREQLAALQQSSGDLAGAMTNARCAVELLPSSSEDWSQLGLILAQQQKYEEATAALRRALAWDPENVWALQNLAQSLVKLGRRDDAIREYRRLLAINPRFGLAWLGLGQLLEEMGRKTEAEDCYRKALANRIHQASELATLARFCQRRGWFEAAATNFDDAIKLSPYDASLYVEAGQNFTSLGRHAQAEQHYAEAVELSPDSMQAHFLYGLELGRAGRPADAAAQFREAVRIRPDLVEARLNLAVALVNEKDYSGALMQFEEVLRQNPTNAMALRYVQALRDRPSPAQSR